MDGRVLGLRFRFGAEVAILELIRKKMKIEELDRFVQADFRGGAFYLYAMWGNVKKMTSNLPRPYV